MHVFVLHMSAGHCPLLHPPRCNPLLFPLLFFGVMRSEEMLFTTWFGQGREHVHTKHKQEIILFTN